MLPTVNSNAPSGSQTEATFTAPRDWDRANWAANICVKLCHAMGWAWLLRIHYLCNHIHNTNTHAHAHVTVSVYLSVSVLTHLHAEILQPQWPSEIIKFNALGNITGPHRLQHRKHHRYHRRGRLPRTCGLTRRPTGSMMPMPMPMP